MWEFFFIVVVVGRATPREQLCRQTPDVPFQLTLCDVAEVPDSVAPNSHRSILTRDGRTAGDSVLSRSACVLACLHVLVS